VLVPLLPNCDRNMSCEMLALKLLLLVVSLLSRCHSILAESGGDVYDYFYYYYSFVNPNDVELEVMVSDGVLEVLYATDASISAFQFSLYKEQDGNTFALQPVTAEKAVGGVQEEFGTIECSNSPTCFFSSAEGTAVPGFGIDSPKFILVKVDLADEVNPDSDIICITGVVMVGSKCTGIQCTEQELKVGIKCDGNTPGLLCILPDDGNIDQACGQSESAMLAFVNDVEQGELSIYQSSSYANSIGQACAESCFDSIYAEMTSTCTLQDPLFGYDTATANSLMCAQNVQCDFCVPLLPGVYGAVSTLILLKEGSVSSCPDGSTVDACIDAYCSELEEAGCCLQTLAPLLDTDESDGTQILQDALSVCDPALLSLLDQTCSVASAGSPCLPPLESPPPFPPPPVPPSPPPVVDPDVVLSLEHVQFDGALNLMYSSKQELAGFQFVLVDASNKPVEVSAVEGGPVAESANFQFAINFGLVLGFSLSGDNIAKAEDGPELLLVMDVSDALAGVPLCLGNIIVTDATTAVLTVKKQCPEVQIECVVSYSPQAINDAGLSGLSPKCGTSEQKSAISVLQQPVLLDNQQIYADTIGQLCKSECFEELYTLSVSQCSNTFQVQSDHAQEEFCAINKECAYCLPSRKELLSNAEQANQCEGGDQECINTFCAPLQGNCCLGTIQKFYADNDQASEAATISASVIACNIDLEEPPCETVDQDSPSCQIENVANPSDNTCLAVWVEAGLPDNVDYFFSQGQAFIAAVASVPPMIYPAGAFGLPEDCYKAKGNCPSFEECFDVETLTPTTECGTLCKESTLPDEIDDESILNPFQVELIVGKVSSAKILKILYKSSVPLGGFQFSFVAPNEDPNDSIFFGESVSVEVSTAKGGIASTFGYMACGGDTCLFTPMSTDTFIPAFGVDDDAFILTEVGLADEKFKDSVDVCLNGVAMFGNVCDLSGKCNLEALKVKVTCDDSETLCTLDGMLLSNEEDEDSVVTDVCIDDAAAIGALFETKEQIFDAEQYSDTFAKACEDDCLVPVYKEIHDVCADLQLESVLFQVPVEDAHDIYCARNEQCNYCVPLLETVGPAVKALSSLSTGSVTSCVEADNEDDCKQILCPIIIDAGCCLTSLSSFYDTEDGIGGILQSSLAWTECKDFDLPLQPPTCEVVSSSSPGCLQSPPPPPLPPPPSPPPQPPPPPLESIELTLRVLVVDNDGFVDIMMKSKVPLAGFQFNVVKVETNQLVNVIGGSSGLAEMFNFEVDIGGFGVVLGFSAAGASIDPQPLEQLLVTLSTSPALQGIPLCLEDVLLGAPGGSAIEVVSVVCEKVVEPCLIDVSAPEASELSATCKAEESQAAISAISQGGFENENNYDESIGQLCHDGCFNPLYEVALQQCDNVGIKVSVNTAHELFCAQNSDCKWCMPFLKETYEAAQEINSFIVTQTCTKADTPEGCK